MGIMELDKNSIIVENKPKHNLYGILTTQKTNLNARAIHKEKLTVHFERLGRQICVNSIKIWGRTDLCALMFEAARERKKRRKGRESCTNDLFNVKIQYNNSFDI